MFLQMEAAKQSTTTNMDFFAPYPDILVGSLQLYPHSHLIRRLHCFCMSGEPSASAIASISWDFL